VRVLYPVAALLARLTRNRTVVPEFDGAAVARAAVIVFVVAVVADLDALELAVATRVAGLPGDRTLEALLDSTARGTAVAVLAVTVVTLFGALGDAVPTLFALGVRDGAGEALLRATAVAVLVVAVVALFAVVELAVAAGGSGALTTLTALAALRVVSSHIDAVALLASARAARAARAVHAGATAEVVARAGVDVRITAASDGGDER
jgi:hypothetical protein